MIHLLNFPGNNVGTHLKRPKSPHHANGADHRDQERIPRCIASKERRGRFGSGQEVIDPAAWIFR